MIFLFFYRRRVAKEVDCDGRAGKSDIFSQAYKAEIKKSDKIGKMNS